MIQSTSSRTRKPHVVTALGAVIVIAATLLVGASPAPAATWLGPTVTLDELPPATTAERSLELAKDVTQVRYRVHEAVLGSDEIHEVLGTTSGVSGRVVFDDAGALVPEQSLVLVDLRGLRTDQVARDTVVQSTILDTGQYPLSRFAPTAVVGLDSWPAAGDAQFGLCGTLTLHGVQQPLCLDVFGHFTSAGVSGHAAGAVSLAAFGITAPQLGPLAAIQDSVSVELEFRAEKGVLATSASLG